MVFKVHIDLMGIKLYDKNKKWFNEEKKAKT